MSHALGLGVTVFAVIFLLELPDKTAVAALLVATRHRPMPVFLGAAAAFVIQSAVAVFAGSLFGLLPRQPIRIGAGVLFLVMAAVVVRRNLRQTEADEEREVIKEERQHHRPFTTAFMVVFVAEWGDLTQLATASLVAKTGQPIPVAIGAIAALWSVTVIAVVTGSQLTRVLAPELLTRASAGLFAVVGAVIIVQALR